MGETKLILVVHSSWAKEDSELGRLIRQMITDGDAVVSQKLSEEDIVQLPEAPTYG